MTSSSQMLSGETVYTIKESGGKFELRGLSDNCVLVCGDQHSAEHYALLLNQAFASGYRQGRRDQRPK